MHAVGIAPGLAGADIELPAMPGAAQHLALAGQAVFAGRRRYQAADDRPATERRALVRAAVDQREEFVG